VSVVSGQPDAHVVHLAVDRVACTGHGVCAALLDGWVLDPEGYPVVLDDRASPAAAATVERMCPARAIYPRAPRSG
jgi:ferredoxin